MVERDLGNHGARAREEFAPAQAQVTKGGRFVGEDLEIGAAHRDWSAVVGVGLIGRMLGSSSYVAPQALPNSHCTSLRAPPWVTSYSERNKYPNNSTIRHLAGREPCGVISPWTAQFNVVGLWAPTPSSRFSLVDSVAGPAGSLCSVLAAALRGGISPWS